MSNNKNKIRGILLAALMVASVFAVAAPAAAAVSTGDRAAASSMAPSDTTTVTVTATMDGDGGSLTLNEAFSGAVADASIESVMVDGESASTVVEAADSNGAVVTLSNTGANAQVEITYEITAASSTGEIDIAGDLSGDGNVDLGTTTISVEGDSEPAPEPEPEPQDSVSATDLDVLLQGEELTVDTSGIASEGDILQIRQGILGDGEGTREATAVVQADGTATFEVDDTEGLDEDFHFFRVNGANVDNTQFQVQIQDLTAEFADDVTTEETATTLDVDSDNWVAQDGVRGSNFDVMVNSDDFDYSELTDIFGVSESDDAEADDGVVLTVEGADDSLEADFDGFETGDYEFTVNAVNTTGEDTASVSVNTPVDTAATFAERTTSQQIGDVASITVDLTGTSTADIRISNDAYTADLSIEDGNDDGEVTILFNTFNAGQTPAAFSAADADDQITSVEQTNIGDNTLVPDSFALDAFVNGERTNRASLQLIDRETGQISSHIAPSGTNFADIELAEALDVQTPRQEVAAGDELAFLISDTSGIFGYAEDLTGEEGVSFELVEQDPGQFQDAAVFNAESDGVEPRLDAENDRIFVAIDTAEAGLEAGTVYEAVLEIDGDQNPYVAEGETEEIAVEVTVTERETSISVIESPYQVTPSENAVVAGTSTLAPGQDVQVEAVKGAPGAFFQITAGEIDENGTWEAAFDFSGQSTGDQFEVTATADGTEDSVTAEFSDTAESETATDAEGLRNEIDNLESQLEEVTSERDELESELENVTSERDELESQLEDVTSERDELESQLEDVTSERDELEQQVSDLETEVADLEEQLQNAGSDDTGGDDSTDSNGPGFGIAAALVALLGAALLAYRRQ